jgi:hypothetical protein
MKRIDVTLNVGVIAPLLDFLRPILKTLESETAFPPEMAEVDRELAGLWREGLIHTQVEDCRRFVALFDASFLNTGQITLTEEHADSLLRATSALRIKLRGGALAGLKDEQLQSREVNLGALTEEQRSGFAALCLMEEIQEIILKHLSA